MRALYDGDDIAPWETVMTIEGDYSLFAHLETVYLGVLTRRTLISTNVRRVVEAAGDKPILFFPARFDHYRVQAGDGWAAHIAGAIGVSTDEQASWWGGKGGGTVPHGLIAAYGGDTVARSRRFAERAHPDVNVVALVDFDNDCVATSLACARALGDRLWGVRLDTSETMVDRSLWEDMGQFRPTGVNPELVRNVRRALDAEGFDHVRIVVSGGFDAAAHPRVRARRRAGRRLRRRFEPAARQGRLHGRRRAGRRPALRQAGTLRAAQPASRAGGVARPTRRRSSEAGRCSAPSDRRSSGPILPTPDVGSRAAASFHSSRARLDFCSEK